MWKENKFDFLSLRTDYDEKELKDALIGNIGKFEPSFIGQLGTYVAAVNHILKTEHDNPTLGI